jgi:hypothetical protein
MSDNGDYVEHTTDTPQGVRREEVRVVRGSNGAGWWVALAIAALVVIGLFAWWNASQNSQADLQAARDQGAVDANLANAAANAQAAATQASQEAQSAMTNSARVTEDAARSAALRAQSSAQSSAQSTADAARNAAATEPAAPPSSQAPAPQ